MESYIEEFKEDCIEAGLTELEALDVICKSLSDMLKDLEKERFQKIFNNLYKVYEKLD